MKMTKRDGNELFLHTGYGLVSKSVKTGSFIRTGNALLYFAIVCATLLLVLFYK